MVYGGSPVSLRWLAPILVTLIVGALAASTYVNSWWISVAIAECPAEPVEGVTSDCGPGCRDDGGGAGRREPCQTDQDCQCLYGLGWYCICNSVCEEIDYFLLGQCLIGAPAGYVMCVYVCVKVSPLCPFACLANCATYIHACLYACKQWGYTCGCLPSTLVDKLADV